MVRAAFVSTYSPRVCSLASYTAELSRVTPDREIVRSTRTSRPTSTRSRCTTGFASTSGPTTPGRPARSHAAPTSRPSSSMPASGWPGGDSVLDFVHRPRDPRGRDAPLAPPPADRRPARDPRGADSDGPGDRRHVRDRGPLLVDEYGADRRAVEVIPTARRTCRASPRVDRADARARGVDAILSFGLLGPDKGFGLMIEALPAIVRPTRGRST